MVREALINVGQVGKPAPQQQPCDGEAGRSLNGCHRRLLTFLLSEQTSSDVQPASTVARCEARRFLRGLVNYAAFSSLSCQQPLRYCLLQQPLIRPSIRVNRAWAEPELAEQALADTNTLVRELTQLQMQ
ncbi:hypothetical protein MHYP_G00334820 [Metynnis hypsauchen]